MGKMGKMGIDSLLNKLLVSNTVWEKTANSAENLQSIQREMFTQFQVLLTLPISFRYETHDAAKTIHSDCPSWQMKATTKQSSRRGELSPQNSQINPSGVDTLTKRRTYGRASASGEDNTAFFMLKINIFPSKMINYQHSKPSGEAIYISNACNYNSSVKMLCFVTSRIW